MNRLISTILGLFIAVPSLLASEYRVVVIPVEFSDVAFRDRQSNVNDKISKAKRYFDDQFTGYRVFSFDVLPVVKLQKTMSWYGANSTARKDERIDQLVRDACALVNRDLSVYDNDGDGIIDNICIISAGESESDGGGVSCIWPQQGFLSERGGTISVSGKTVDSFTVCAEESGFGTFCHEYAHSFGLQDLYDTDGNGSGGTSAGVWGSLSLMDEGSKNDGGNTPPNFCAVELEQLGIGKPVELRQGYHTLRPVSSSKEYLRIESDSDGEYFLLECRDKSGWDAYAGGGGLLVYHIDRSANNSWYSDYYKHNLSAAERWSYNQVNCRPDRQCARIIPAVPNAREVKNVFFPQPGHSALGAETDPPFKYWSGATSELLIHKISVLDDGSVSFSVIIPITMREISAFQDAAILNWSADNSLDVKECQVSWHKEGNSTVSGTSTMTIPKQEDGFYYAILEKLSPATEYSATIKLICEDGSVHSKSGKFTTKSMQKNVRPFIYLRFTRRSEDGRFYAGESIPLRVYNAQDVQNVTWYFNDRPIFPDNGGFWLITGSGTLKAKVWYKDGSADVIIKEIEVL